MSFYLGQKRNKQERQMQIQLVDGNAVCSFLSGKPKDCSLVVADDSSKIGDAVKMVLQCLAFYR